MSSTKKILTILALAVGVGVMPARGQEEREDLEQRLRDLRREMRQLERELDRTRDRASAFAFRGPRILTLNVGRAQLGVFVRTGADEDTDPVGAVLEGVTSGGPADEAGLQAGDIITRFNDESLAGRYPPAGPDESEPAMKLIDLVRDMDEGDEATIEYRRGDETYTTIATLRRLPAEETAWAFPFEREGRLDLNLPSLRVLGEGRGLIAFLSGAWSDIELVGINEGLGRYFGTDEGLLVVRSPREESMNLQAGDVILTIDGRKPRSPSRALRILRSYDAGETIVLEIMRDKRAMTVEATVPDEGEDHMMRDRVRRREF